MCGFATLSRPTSNGKVLKVITMQTQAVNLQEGALAEVPSILESHEAERVFFVVDETAYTESGGGATLDRCLASRSTVRFDGFEPNPKLEAVERGIQHFREFRPDIVVAFGGGTAIDLAKMIAVFANHEGSVRELVHGGVSIRGRDVPFVAIPTTAGTGSEATHFAVVYVDGQKYSIAHPCLLPDFAIIDPLLTHSLPPNITASTGLDAFCQAIESVWAVGATDESVEYATEATRLALEHLVEATLSPTPEARFGMSRASVLAGKAINIGKTTLPHALSYFITSEYGIPHGEAVALTLSAAFAYNAAISSADCLDPCGPNHVRQRIRLLMEIFGACTVEEACGTIREVITKVGCAASPREAGIATFSEYERIASQVNTQRLSNNPRRTTHAALVALLSEQ